MGIVRDPRRAIGIAARRYYRSPRPFEPVLESFLNLRGADGLMPGYGWIFFLPDGVLNVGAGLLSTFRGFQGTSAKRVFDVFVKGLPPEWDITEENALGPLMSGPLPTAMNRRPAAVPGMLLVGDAAGWSTRSTARASRARSSPAVSRRTWSPARSPGTARR